MRSMSKLTEKVHLLRSLERQAEDLATQINILKDELKSEMESRGVNELAGDDWKITWTPYITSRFDQKVFKSAHPDLYESFCVATNARRFTLK